MRNSCLGMHHGAVPSEPPTRLRGKTYGLPTVKNKKWEEWVIDVFQRGSHRSGINFGPESVSRRTRDESEAGKATSERGSLGDTVRSYIVRSEHKGGLSSPGILCMMCVFAGSFWEEKPSTVVFLCT